MLKTNNIIIIVLASLFLGCSKPNPSRKEIRKKVGQLFLLAFSGDEPDIVTNLIKDRGIGGLYLSNDNLRNPKKAVKLLNELQKTAMLGISKQPLLTAADQEGAWAVMVPYSTSGPGNMALGACPPKNTFEMYSIFSEELSSIGVFCDLSPVSDVNSNPDNPIIGTRSFGDNPEQVGLRVKEAIKGLHSNNVIAAAKHFPGHGNTNVDTHKGIPKVDRSLNEVENIDVLPFKIAISSGVDMVMTSHIIYKCLDSVYPATLSKKILSEYLRKKLNFNGIIITDSFNMGSIQNNYDPTEAAILAIQSGADMIMLAEERYGEEITDYIESQIKLLDGVENAVIQGRIPFSRIEESYNRIISLKNKYKLSDRILANSSNAEKIVGSKKNKDKAVLIAEKSLRTFYKTKGILPLSKKDKVTIVKLSKENVSEIIKIGAGIGPNYANAYSDFLYNMKESGFNIKEHTYDDIKDKSSVVIVVSENYPFPGKTLSIKEQHRRMEVIRKNNPKSTIINVALRNPYDAYIVKEYVDTYVTSFGSNISNIKAIVNLLAGKVKVTNSNLPVLLAE